MNWFEICHNEVLTPLSWLFVLRFLFFVIQNSLYFFISIHNVNHIGGWIDKCIQAAHSTWINLQQHIIHYREMCAVCGVTMMLLIWHQCAPQHLVFTHRRTRTRTSQWIMMKPKFASSCFCTHLHIWLRATANVAHTVAKKIVRKTMKSHFF